MNVSRHPEPTEPDGPDLATYLRWLRRHWWIIGMGAVLGMAGGYLAAAVQTPVYQATTQVVVRAVETGDKNGAVQNKINLDTEAQVVRSLVVAEKARGALGTALSADRMSRRVGVTVPPNSQVLNITYGAETAQAAQAGSRALAAAYLDLRGTDARRRMDEERKALDGQIAAVTKRLDGIARQIARAKDESSERERAIADRNVLTDQLRGLNERRSPLVASAVHPGDIISEARLPESPSAPNAMLYLVSGLGAGLLLGLCLAAFADRLDRRVRHGRDLAERFAPAVLMEAPGQVNAVGIVAPGHPLAAEIGRLRNVLATTGPPPAGRGRTVLVTGASTGHAAAFVVANLAAAYARTGQQVVAVCATADSALVNVAAPGGAAAGLSDVLRRDTPALAALSSVTDLPSLRVLLPGALDAVAELPLAALAETLDTLADRFDHVLVHAASPRVSVEAQALANHVDAVLVVAESGRTRRTEVAGAIARFDQVGVEVAGLALAPRVPDGVVPRRVPPTQLPGRGRPAVAAAPVPTTPASAGPARRPADDSTMILPRMIEVAPPPAPGRMQANGRAVPRQAAPDPRESAR
ncbi:hypothetical protein GCM10010124_26890 [Pilimelia terevasa]|uniref:Polysaccharide chain length determinant N-terminal domain-containing protein n=1 Tax=Pilimelia terevasa TaxID=53372 RepID=A0A8J3BMV5_9ACTN|nr:Wzz/FepE/Etk N-terminal domain-containing protein [Pilimelia terevasa]GGK32757.1 hypothetical protein GCM10010124_26890 [Pilimelia terevasa]